MKINSLKKHRYFIIILTVALSSLQYKKVQSEQQTQQELLNKKVAVYLKDLDSDQKQEQKSTPNLFNKKLLAILLNDFKKYKTTNIKFHAGDLYEHSIWDSNATANWWTEKKFWTSGINKKYQVLTNYAALLHDIGKAGDLVYTFYDKKDHPETAFAYLTNQKPYLLNANGLKFNFDEFFKGYEEERKIIAILTGIHWEFGSILKERDKGQEEEKLFEKFFNILKKLVEYVHYNNGIVDEQIVRMAILVGAADVKGSEYVASKKSLFNFSDVQPTHPLQKKYPYEKYKYDEYGKELRNDLLSYFHELKKQPTLKKPTTQTEALLSIPYIRHLVQKLYGPTVKKYKNIIDQMIQKEEKYAPTHFVFYHGASVGQFVLYEAIKTFYEFFYPHTGISESFQALRTPYAQLFDQYKTIREFTENQVNFYTSIHDTPSAQETAMIEELTGKKIKELTKKEIENAKKKLEGKINWDIPSHLLSVNLSLFGNIGKKTLSECTFDYFAADKRRKSATSLAWLYEKNLKEFGIPKSVIPAFEALAKSITKDVGVIYQIFIPKNKINNILYLARDYGKPFGSPESLGLLFNRNIAKEKRLPAFWELLEKDPEAALGKPMTAYQILTRYINNPTSIPNINRLQARILITNEQLLNPSSDTKIFVYTALTPAEMDTFKEKLYTIAGDAFTEFLQQHKTKSAAQNVDPESGL